ncbi:MAG: hypothetical protein WCK37_01130 [Candidatus Falkowbacteria bacterium]
MENFPDLNNNEVPKLPGLKVVGKINLPENTRRFSKKIEGRDSLREKLDLCLNKMATKTNVKFPEFLRDDARINMLSDDYYYHDKTKDLATIQYLETTFAAGQDFYDWNKKREESNGILVEKAITVLLDKVLGADFIVTRTSLYDDYRHGVDNLLIDKATGAAICGFDEVQVANIEESDKNEEIKKHKILENNDKYNGTFVKYGATIRDGEFKRCSLHNVPTFFLSLSENDLAEIAADLEHEAVSDKERSVLLRMIASMEKQMIEIYGEHSTLDNDWRAERLELKKRLELLSVRYGVTGWSRTPEGLTLKKELGINKLRLNLNNFKESLKTIKKKVQ